MIDVTMGSFDGAEVCELIGLFLLNNLSDKYGKNDIGLYRDDGLVLLRNASGPQSERTKKDITREFKKQGLKISISTNADLYLSRLLLRAHLPPVELSPYLYPFFPLYFCLQVAT